MSLVLNKLVDIVGDQSLSKGDITSDGTYFYTFSLEKQTLDGKSFRIATAADYKFETEDSGIIQDINSVACNADLIVAVGDAGKILTSTDGVLWTLQASGVAQDLYGVVWSGVSFVVVGAVGKILTSPDGIIWTLQVSGVSAALRGIAWSGTEFVVVGALIAGQPAILTSTNGVFWVTVTSAATAQLNAVIYSGAIYLAVGDSGLAMTSADSGATWTVQTTGTAVSLKSCVFAAGLFVAVGASGKIITSPTAVVWSNQASGVTVTLNNIIYTNSIFVVVGNAGTMLTSADSIIWEFVLTITNADILHALRFEAFLVLVGNIGLVLKTPVISGLTLFKQTFDATQVTEYQVEVVIKLISGDIPRIYLYDETHSIEIGSLDLSGLDSHYRRFTRIMPPSAVGTASASLVFEFSGSTECEIALGKVLSNIVPDLLINSEMEKDIAPRNDIPDNWVLTGTPYVASIIDESEEQIISIYKFKLNGFSAENVLGGTNYWYQIKLPATVFPRLAHITGLGGASFKNTTNYGERISLVYSWFDGYQAFTVLLMFRPQDRQVYPGVINNIEMLSESIAAASFARVPSGSIVGGSERDVFVIMEENNLLKVYELPITINGLMTFVTSIALEIGGAPVSMDWDPDSGMLIIQNNESTLVSGLPGLLYVDMINPAIVQKSAALPEPDNIGICQYFGKVLVGCNFSSNIGYIVDNNIVPVNVSQSWSDMQVPADGVSERAMTLTVNSNFGIPVGANVPIQIEGFKAGNYLLSPTKYFDGQSLTDQSIGKAVTASSDDKGAAANLTDNSDETKWASSTYGANATIDLGADSQVDYVYYDAGELLQKFKIELLTVTNSVLYTFDYTTEFAGPKLLLKVDLIPALTNVRRIKLTITESATPSLVQCYNLQAIYVSGVEQDGRFYLPGGFGIPEKDTAISPFLVKAFTDNTGKINLVYRSGSEGNNSLQQVVFRIL